MRHAAISPSGGDMAKRWRRGTVLRPFCHLVLRSIRGDSPPWENTTQPLSESLRKYRLEANLTQATLAARLGVTVGTLGTWERGQATPERRSWPGLLTLLKGYIRVVPHPLDSLTEMLPEDFG